MTMMASQIASLTIVYSTVYSGADQRKHQSSASLAFARGIHRWPVNSPHKGSVTRKMFPFGDIIMYRIVQLWFYPLFTTCWLSLSFICQTPCSCPNTIRGKVEPFTECICDLWGTNLVQVGNMIYCTYRTMKQELKWVRFSMYYLWSCEQTLSKRENATCVMFFNG